MRRIERLINLIAALLEAPRPMTAEEIRARIAGYDQDNAEAFRRAFERDKEALRAMGIPLEVVATDPFAEQADGYIISKDRYYLAELDLEPDELAALRLAAMGAGEQAETGFMKLSMSEGSATPVGPSVIVGAYVGAEQPHLEPLYAAMLDHRPVSFRYENARGEISARRVEPHQLIHRAGQWYLVGRDTGDGEQKTFKLSRFTSDVEALQGSYELPGGGHRTVGTEAWEFGGDEPTPAIVRFEPDSRWWAEQNLSRFPSEERDDGSVDVEMRVTNLDALVGWVLEFQGRAVIVSPPEARERLLEHLAPFLGEAPRARKARA